MLAPKEQFPVGTYVKLKDGIDPSFYNGFSRVGNEGWVRKRKKDQYGYGHVFIEWNKNAWAYNGTEDGWTWASHFEAVEQNKMDDSTPQNNQEELEDRVRGITENFVKALFGTLGAPVEQIGEVSNLQSDSEKSDAPDKWNELAIQACDTVIDSSAYLVIALEHVQAPGAPPMIIPHLFHAAREPEHALIVQSQLAHVVASFQDATIARVLENEQETDEGQ